MNYTNNIRLIFPPGWTPTSPYLALPLLKGYAKQHSIDMEIRDYNIEFYDWILKNDIINRYLLLAKKESFDLNKKALLDNFEIDRYKNLFKILMYEDYLSEIEKWKEKFKNVKSAQSYSMLSKIILTAFDLVGLYNDMKISLNSIDSKIYKLTNPHDLSTFVSNDNLFLDFYKSTNLLDGIRENVIGFSITSRSQLASGIVACKYIKENYPSKTVYLGGNFITRVFNGNFSDEIISPLFDYIDFVNLYEGETFIDYLDMVDDLSEIPNLVMRRRGKIIRTKVVKINYCEYIVPDFDGFALNKYFTPELVLPLLSSKNCYSHCAFCTIPFSSSNRNYHQFSIDKIVSTMDILRDKYNTHYFMFNDEVFSIQRIIEMARYLKGNHRDYKWYCESRFDTPLTDAQAKEIYDGGCMHIQFGLESYNQRVIDKMNKKINVSNVDAIVETLLRNNVSVHLFAIFGFPTETLEEMNNTKKYLLDFMKKSHEKYHIENATIGYGTFALEKGSTVYENPIDFDIKTIYEPSDNFELSLNYEVKDGIQPKYIEKYVKKFNYISELDQNTFKADQICLFEDGDSFTYKMKKLNICFDPIVGVKRKDMIYLNLNNGVYIFKSEIRKECLKDALSFYEFNDDKRIYDSKMMYAINPFLTLNNGKCFELKLNNEILMSELMVKIFWLYNKYGYALGKYQLLVHKIFSLEELEEINERLYMSGILLKVSTIEDSYDIRKD